ncbi:MAG TPA: M14-type cytosolic carboxypeptidase [Abditibacteriaceae bacterium]|jgi:hypothetical protein
MLFEIDSDFPSGNIIVDRIDGDTVFLRQDWESSREWWFYWHFRVRGAQRRNLRFQFTDGDVFAACGPCVNRDQQNWYWLGRDAVKDNGFSFEFGDSDDEVYFAFCFPYHQTDYHKLLLGREEVQQTLCLSEQNRPVDHFFAPSRHGGKFALFTARTHACETMANFVLEGVMESWHLPIEDEGFLDVSDYLQENIDLHIIPFMDKDGVENGEQGKNRKPHDHNRDFTDSPLYASTRALMEQAPTWGECVFYLDLHCPWIRGGRNEELFFLGLPPENHMELKRFMEILQATQTGPLRFDARHTIMPGQEWYQSDAPTVARWARLNLSPKIATTLEIPYALAGGEIMTPGKAHLFGMDLGRAIGLYVQS